MSRDRADHPADRQARKATREPFVPYLVPFDGGLFGVYYVDEAGEEVGTQFADTREKAEELASFLGPHLKDWRRSEPPGGDVAPGVHAHAWLGYLRYSDDPAGRFFGYVCQGCGERKPIAPDRPSTWDDSVPPRIEAYTMSLAEMLAPPLQEEESRSVPWLWILVATLLAALVLAVLYVAHVTGLHA